MWTAFLVALAQAGQGGAGPDALPAPIPLSLRVNDAIARGARFLEGLQAPDGSFPSRHDGLHPGGGTALATFTLLHAGLRREDQSVRRALDALSGIAFRSTYSASVHLLLCEALRDQAPREAAQRSLDFLLEHQDQGVWAYPWGRPCDSNTQFAMLGLRAAQHLGLEVREEVLLDVLDGLKMFQTPSGAFSYDPRKRNPYASITAGALSSYAVLRELSEGKTRLRRALDKESERIAEGEAWLEEHLDLSRNTYDDGAWTTTNQYPLLYAVERWCGLTRRERVGTRDWYTLGATWLLENQERDGAWGLENPLDDTCFALLFLRRATVTEGGGLEELNAELARERERAPPRQVRPGAAARRLTEWWVAGPWPKVGREVLLLDPPFQPSEIRPRERGKIGHREWRRVSLPAERWVDLDRFLEDEGDQRLWLLVTGLCVPGEKDGPARDLVLWLELDDGWDVRLDGKSLSRERRRTTRVTGDVRIDLHLQPGRHQLAILVDDFQDASAFGALLTDAANAAPPESVRECPEER